MCLPVHAPVRALAHTHHRQNAWPIVPQHLVEFVLKLATPNRLATGAVSWTGLVGGSTILLPSLGEI